MKTFTRSERAATGKTTVQLFKATRDLLDAQRRGINSLAGFSTYYPDVDAYVYALLLAEDKRRAEIAGKAHRVGPALDIPHFAIAGRGTVARRRRGVSDRTVAAGGKRKRSRRRRHSRGPATKKKAGR